MKPSLGARIEDRVRSGWEGGASGGMRLAGAGYGLVAGLRNLLYDSGVLAPRHAPIPVVSVGGLTVGGSGKTPITADIAARLCEAGIATAIVTHGFADEMDVHRRLAPGARVYGGRDRVGLCRQAAAEGAGIAVVDSGFQHRRLHRDIDLVTVDERTLGRRMAYLPAGPHREGLGALGRADFVVVVRRYVPGSGGERTPEAGAGPIDRAWIEDAARRLGCAPFIRARIHPGRLVAASPAAAASTREPALAVAGIMWPDVFFAQVRSVCRGVEDSVSLRDHARIGTSEAQELRRRAGERGLVCTLKDAGKLVDALGEDVPIWYLSESVEWVEPGGDPTPVRAALSLLPDGPFDSSPGESA